MSEEMTAEQLYEAYKAANVAEDAARATLREANKAVKEAGKMLDAARSGAEVAAEAFNTAQNHRKRQGELK